MFIQLRPALLTAAVLLAASPTQAQGLIAEVAALRAELADQRRSLEQRLDAQQRRLECAEQRLSRPPVLEEIARTEMTELRFVNDSKARDLPGARLEIPAPVVRGRQVMVQYNFSRHLTGSASHNWVMYRLIVDGVERPQARGVVSAFYAVHSGVWIGPVEPGYAPVVVEVEYAAHGNVTSNRTVNQPYTPVAEGEAGSRSPNYSAANGPYQAAGIVVYLLSPPPLPEGCQRPTGLMRFDWRAPHLP